MTGRGEIETRRERIADLCRKHRVARLVVFGSVVRADFDPKRSDIDLLVEFMPDAAQPWAGEYFDFKQDLEVLFARSVDLCALAASRNPYIAATIERDQELLYAA